MNEDRLQLPQQTGTRRTLRCAGITILCVGGLLTLIGMGSFFAAFSSTSMEPPRFFWCAFLGLPLLVAGGVMTSLGFMGAFQRYVAGEVAPVAKDAANYMGENVQPAVKSIAKAVTEGIKEGLKEEQDPKK
jgi:hypothetical protein